MSKVGEKKSFFFNCLFVFTEIKYFFTTKERIISSCK